MPHKRIGKLIDKLDRKSYIGETMNVQTSLQRLVAMGMTQRCIADELGCTQAHVSQLINGKTGHLRPSAKIVEGIKRLERLSKALGAGTQIIVSPERKKD